jgi:uncharacterized membrane protein YeaQ/YmgE (transglycosylase-associated protein family)
VTADPAGFRRDRPIGPDGGSKRRLGTWVGHSPMSSPTVGKEDAMGVIGWIVFGLLVGIVARFLMPGRDPGGFVITAIIGIVGALLGGYLGRAIGWYREGEAAEFVMAVIGSIVLLALYRLVVGRRHTLRA